MLENVLFGNIQMPGELIRIAVAFIGTIAASYFDVFNKKNVPDKLLFGFLGIAFLVNLVFFQEDLFWFSLALSIIVSAIGYLFYRLGQIGGADVIVLASIMLLLPVHPSMSEMPFNLPFVFSVIVYSGVIFAIYVMAYFALKLRGVESKPRLAYLLLFLAYFAFAYVYINSFLFSLVYFIIISVLLFATIFFMVFRDDVIRLLSEAVPIGKVEPEDVLALEVMNKDLVERFKIPRLMTEDEIERLKKTKKVAEVWVYTRLPPFLPFLLAGMVLAILFGRALILI